MIETVVVYLQCKNYLVIINIKKTPYWDQSPDVPQTDMTQQTQRERGSTAQFGFDFSPPPSPPLSLIFSPQSLLFRFPRLPAGLAKRRPRGPHGSRPWGSSAGGQVRLGRHRGAAAGRDSNCGGFQGDHQSRGQRGGHQVDYNHRGGKYKSCQQFLHCGVLRHSGQCKSVTL